jgi:hypothetical protein
MVSHLHKTFQKSKFELCLSGFEISKIIPNLFALVCHTLLVFCFFLGSLVTLSACICFYVFC